MLSPGTGSHRFTTPGLQYGVAKNRFSGPGPTGQLSVNGGLYFSRQTSAMSNEVWHYSDNATTVPRALTDVGVIQLGVIRPLLVLDMSRYAASTSAFLRSLEMDSEVRCAMKHSRTPGAHLEQLLLAHDDYTVGRALGMAAATSRFVEGLQAGTARPSDRPDETGDNIVLYGPDGEPLQNMVVAQSVTLFAYNGKKKEVEIEKHEVIFDHSTQKYKEKSKEK